MNTNKRKYNFSAGPAILPEPVLNNITANLYNYNGTGLGLAEISHRSELFSTIHESAKNGIRELLKVPDNYKILFMQGGATGQFSAVPINFANLEGKANYIDSGIWSQKAIKEAQAFTDVHICASGADNHYSSLPTEFNFSDKISYIHFTSNNTIYGTQFREEPECPDGFLVCDASSDILSRPLDVTKYGLIYASTQKNLGIAGLTVVILKEELIDCISTEPATVLDYRTYVKSDSLYNTPPTLAIYCVAEVCKWLQQLSGLEYIDKNNEEKAKLLYSHLEQNDFYTACVAKADQSLMNVCFRLASDELTAKFIEQAESKGFIGLKGHRLVGGVRASIYNAFPTEGVHELLKLMKSFSS